jgi:hypothetical protein
MLYTFVMRTLRNLKIMSQRPWTIIATFPGHQPKAIARTSYKADAEAHIRFLQRYMSKGTYTLTCESESAEHSDQLPVPS